MKKFFQITKQWLIPLTALSLVSCLTSCSSDPQQQASREVSGLTNQRVNSPDYTNQYVKTSSRSKSQKMSELYAASGVKKDLLPRSARGRTKRRMTPLYVTIHSTQNWSNGADAYRHSLALKRGKLSTSWHYTVDEDVAIQHLATTEQGKHADFDGPGNRYSIGIEMCEHPGNSLRATIERTAKLTAFLMHKHNLSLSRVKPHYHWPRYGKNPENKNCPHFLLDNGKPGRKWNWFLNKVNYYYQLDGEQRYVRNE